jgi:uncharacterized protein
MQSGDTNCFSAPTLLPLINDLIDDNCRWVSAGPVGKLPWAGSYKGKQEIATFFTRLGRSIEFTEFTPHDMIKRGDTVVVLGTSSGRMRANGKSVKTDWAHVAKYDGGKLVFFQDYSDTATLLLAMT